LRMPIIINHEFGVWSAKSLVQYLGSNIINKKLSACHEILKPLINLQE